MTNNNETTDPTGKQRGSGSLLMRIVMLWGFLKTDDAWFLVFIAFSVWSFFIATDNQLLDLVNLLVGFALLIIWNLTRIAAALENRK